MPLQKVDPDKVLSKQASELSHVLFVNVDQALDARKFREAVSAITFDTQVNVAVAEVKGLPPDKVLSGRTNRDERLSERAKIVVYVIDNARQNSFQSAVGRWSIVNLHGFDGNLPKDNPERYDRRLRQLMSKGLALACGMGATGDFRCVLYYKSFSVDGIDKTSTTFSMEPGMTIVELLNARFGDSIFQRDEAEKSK